MNGPSKITADYSSIVGLKAELLRKRLEAQELKNKIPTQNVPKHKPKVKETKPPKEKEKSPKIVEIEDINLLKKSKLMLEAKSKLYDKLKNSPRNKNDLFLVDFSNKSEKSETDSETSDNEEEFRERNAKKEESEPDEEQEDQNYDSDDNFVEYQDCFGRTRKCLREDLPKMQDKDNLLKQQISKEPVENPPAEVECQPEPPQLEPEIEIMRKKWEEQTNRLSNKDNIYYQDVLFDEARTHGVGYYNFSIDEDERAKQQQNLEKLRKETEQKQQEMQNLKEMRQKMEQNRLKVARIRQRIRAGLPPELPEDEHEKNSDDNPVSMGNSSEHKQVDLDISENKKQSSDVNSLAIIEDKVKAFGELLGKRPPWREMSQEEWVHKRRRDRINEFAPNYDNFKRAGVLVTKNNSDISRQNSQRSTEIPPVSLSEQQDEDSDDSEIIGPMPAFIPLPPNPPLSTIPLPPSPKESTSTSFPINSETKTPIDSNTIAAGLKYLRAKFEEKEKS